MHNNRPSIDKKANHLILSDIRYKRDAKQQIQNPP